MENKIYTKRIIEKVDEMIKALDNFSDETAFYTYNENDEVIFTLDYGEFFQDYPGIKYEAIHKGTNFVVFNMEIDFNIEEVKKLNQDFHYHNYNEIITLIKGKAVFYEKDEEGNEYTDEINTGAIKNMPSKRLHKFLGEGVCKIQLVISL